ncbi:MAG: RNA methyltransferase [Cyclobacteriaceae bacterium]|nr:RNA methyltransferase [Cyclobacteriaceae bacterium]
MANEEQTILITQHLSQYLSDHKKSVIEHVLDQRTRHVAIVLEDIFQSQNASAVFRTAECFGIQDVHLIENRNKYSVNKRVLKGADKWLTVRRHRDVNANNSFQCLSALKLAGYRILATLPNATQSLHEIDITRKVAVVMGNELHGLSQQALDLADDRIRIPMYGFTESLNLSVSAAICINEVISKLHQSSVNWKLTEEEKNGLRLEWYRKSIRNSSVIIKQYLSSID